MPDPNQAGRLATPAARDRQTRRAGLPGQRSLIPDADPPRCRRCGAPLTNPESVAAGLGPRCRETTDFPFPLPPENHR